ncbi:MAG: hypothetical protein AAGA59_03030 [Actinomycetota bacterium]
MSGDELDAYRDGLACVGPLAPIKPIPTAEEGLDWWTPGEPEALIGCSLDDPGWFRRMQIDTVDPAAPVVYLSALSL